MRAVKLLGIFLGIVLIGINARAPLGFAQSTLTIDGVVLRDANLRAGPGLTYEIIGAAKAGEFVLVTDYAGDWYQLSSGEWIAKILVGATLASRVVAFRLEDAPAKANSTANLRRGPGISYPIVGQVQAGQNLQIIGQNQAGDWFKLVGGQWIAAFLVYRVTVGLPVVDETPTPQPVNTPEPPPPATPLSPLPTPPR